MCTKQLFSGNTGITTISVANSNRNGTGTLGTAFTASANGSRVRSITIKAIGSTTEGMVRLFTASGGAIFLYKEIFIPSITQTSVVPAFEFTIYEILYLNSGDIIYASTENAESFNVVVNATDITNCTCADDVGPSHQNYALSGLAKVDTANPNLDGTGTISTAILAPSTSGSSGTKISYINIKAMQSTTQGMIRFFIYDGSQTLLFSEVRVPAVSQTSIEPSFRTTLFIGFFLKAGYSIKVSTENSESFSIITIGNNIVNCPCL